MTSMMLRAGRGLWRSARLSHHVALRGGVRNGFSHVRCLATLKADLVGDVVDNAAKARPLKDAVKYLETQDDKLLSWSTSQMKKHTDAFANGLLEAGFKLGDKIALWMPLGAVEFAVAVLGASKAGVTAVVVDPPADEKNCDLGPLKAALAKYQPRGVMIWGDYAVGGDADTAVLKIISELFPEVSTDASMRATFTKLTAAAKPPSAEFPFVDYVIHTGFSNIRGTLTFKNLLLYSAAAPVADVSGKLEVLIAASTGKAATHAELLKAATKRAKDLGLSGDHSTKSGRLVINSAKADSTVIEGLVAALMSETLVISPAYMPSSEQVEQAAATENAVVL